ncbi:aspartyl-tRNA synthetase [Annulohypoxylon truncatum]|uniref:aspartyl-tRNA synthetase n=1 Tax=Annulohypoxylon truncatum TaxID=327061 RepID=UPI002007D95C|nr:aspartyl-tRNA synthetase [Annulohypoxylon truncatum]KAI1209062.1 aspartyl-tRNA synthetase [Annulohypoxylon truncatum]
MSGPLGDLAHAITSPFRSSKHETEPSTPEKGKSAQRTEAKQQEKLEKSERRQQDKDEIEQRRRQEDEIAEQEEDEETKARYGENVHPHELCSLERIVGLPEGSEVNFRARIHTLRRLSQALTFLLFRHQTDSIQGVLSHASPHMIRWVQRLNPESLVHVTGTLQKPKEPVTSATFSDIEVLVYSIHLVNPANDLPFDNYQPPDALRQRLSGRVVDLRHPSNQAIFRIRSMIVRKFRESLEDQGFLEIQTPKLQPAATESGSEVFKVQYFGRTAFLAQSPQLPKQMVISADFKKVYEIGPVFRAENSNTHRHLTEYTGLDIEMSLKESYRELIETIDKFLRAIFTAVQSMPELNNVRERWPSKDLVWLDETPIIPFTEGIQMLRDDGREVEEEDLSTRDEMRLGELVKEKYQTDYYVLDKFPANARPFYTHKAEDPKWTNSFDIFLRGQEICTGGQRIHDAKELRASMAESKISEQGMEEYLSAFDLGAPPHGGAGLGLERIVMLLLELDDVRNASLFPRDPKSLPAGPPMLPHPDANTLAPRGAQDEYPPIEKLIANYGDATNTSWLDERFEIWRHPTGAAVGFVRQAGKFAMIAGDPLCDRKQYHDVITSFVNFVRKDLHLTPVWMLVSEEVQQVLGTKMRWRTLSCAEEQRVDADQHHNTSKGREARRVQCEGITIGEVVDPDENFMRRADNAIREWQAGRRSKGKQVHLTEVRPWVDREHRRYFAAEKEGAVLGLVVLAQLAPRHGWQVKWAFDFPSAPNGTIEVLVETALSALSGPVTFGAGVSERLTPGAQLSGVRAKFLANTYDIIVRNLRLGGKARFREKFGALGEQVYICYPRHGLGVRDLQQIVKFFED